MQIYETMSTEKKEPIWTDWYGVDLDGTLAYDRGWKGDEHIGEPIPRMVEFVRKLLAEGKDVRIVTARVHPTKPQAQANEERIRAWTLDVFGVELPVTCCKDPGMKLLYDDRAVAILPNSGMPAHSLFNRLIHRFFHFLCRFGVHEFDFSAKPQCRQCGAYQHEE